MSTRKRIGLAGIGLGLVAAVVAFVLYLQIPAPTAGDIVNVERSLAEEVEESAPLSEDLSEPAESEEDPPAQSEAPLWRPNANNQLGAVEDQPVPIGLTVDALGVDAPVGPYGINERTGQMAVPNNVRDVAWYQHGPAPGEPGSAVLAAHVDLLSQGPGVFFNLESMDPGDIIQVHFDNGMSRNFEVVAREKYEKEQLPLDVVFSRSGPSTLTLITCGGGFDSSSARYDSNVVVYARPLTPTPPSGLAS